MTTLVQRTIQGLIFDLDGTLVDTSADIAAGVNVMRASWDLPPLSVAEIVACIGNGAHNLVRRVLLDAPGMDNAEALDRFRAWYSEHMLDQAVLYPGVAQLLERLQEGGKLLAVATNKTEENARRMLGTLGIGHFFSLILGNDGERPIKPDPAIVYQILQHWDLDARQVLLVGDSSVDVATAHNAGVPVVFFSDGMGCLAEDDPPEYRVSRMGDVFRLLPLPV